MKRPECLKKCVSGYAASFLPDSVGSGRRGDTAPSTQKAAALPSSSHPVKRNEARRGEAEQIGRGIWKLYQAVPDGAGEAVRRCPVLSGAVRSCPVRSDPDLLPDRGGCAAGLASSPYRMDDSQIPASLPS